MGDRRLDAHWRTVKRSKSNPDHLSHADLYDAEKSRTTGKPAYHSPILKIADVSIGLVKSQESPNGDELIFLHFERVHRKLGLNTTNSKTLAKLTGREAPSGWIGATIQLYVDPQAKYPKGEKGPAIRIRPTVPKGAVDAGSLPDVPDADRERLDNERDERLGREPGEDG